MQHRRELSKKITREKMVGRFSFPVFLLSLLLLMCAGEGNAVLKVLEEKRFAAYFHRSIDSVETLDNQRVDDVEEKSSSSQSSSEIVKHFENPFHKNVNQHEKTKSNPRPSSKTLKDHHDHHNMGHNHADESAAIGLFTIDDVRAFHVGQKLPIFFPIKNHSLYRPFLPKQVADSIPFSSSQITNILRLFSVSPDSPKGQAVRNTVQLCELEEAVGEIKVCATSLESMISFLRNVFGPEADFKYISTSHPTITTPILQNYTVLEPAREVESAKKVGCHPLPYVYAIYFCHFDETETKAFKLKLMGETTGDKVDAVVVCHMDTSGWSPNHISLRMLGVKHGSSVCHVFSQGNIVWIQSTTKAAM